MKLPADAFVDAKYYEAYEFSIFGSPKLTIICGKCSANFATREYRDFKKMGKDAGVVGNCPHCGKWNIVPLKRI